MKVTKQKMSPLAASLIIAVVAMTVLAAGLFLVVLPQRDRSAELDREVADVRAEVVQKRAESLRKAPAPIRVAELFKLVQAMPDKTDMAGILLQLNQTARDTGITFDGIEPQLPLLSTDHTTYPINLQFTGTFYELNDFVYRLRSLVSIRRGTLEATGRLFSINAIDFGQGVGGFPNIAAKVTVNAFVYGATPVPGAAPAPAPAETAPADEPPAAPEDTTAVAAG